MIDILHELQEQLSPVLRAGDLAQCERTVAGRLAALPPSPFHIALDLAITNPPAAVAAHFDQFFRPAAARANIGAAYTEMNALDVHPDRWFCEVFTLREYGGHDDYDWLAERQPERSAPFTITGLEDLQKVYASGAFQEKRFRDASYVVGLLVVTKFQDLNWAVQQKSPWSEQTPAIMCLV